MEFKILKEMNEKQQVEFDKARANPDLPQSIKLFERAQASGYISPVEEKPEISPAESGITGASVGGSFGLTRPVAALAGMAPVAIGGGGLSPSESWKKSGEFINQAKEQNPKSYAGGMVASLVGPGGGVSMAGKLAKAGLATKGVKGALATLGATSLASGMSAGGTAMAEDKPLSDVADEVLKGAAMNTAVTGASQVLGAGIKKLLPGLRNIPEDVVDTYSKNKKAVNTLIKQKLEGFVPELVDDTASKISDLGKNLEKQLGDITSKHAVPIKTDDVVKELKNQISQLERVAATPDKRSALATLKKTLQSFYTKTSGMEEIAEDAVGTISYAPKTTIVSKNFTANDLLELKRDFQRAAESVYEGNSSGPVNDAFAAIADKAANALKTQVKGTGAILKAEQEAIKAKLALGLTGNAENINAPGRMKTLLATLFNPDKIQKGTTEQVRNFDRIYGTNLEEASKLFRAASSLGVGDVISGFKTGARVLAPAAGGAFLGPAGFAAGALMQAPPMTRPLITMSNELPGVAGRLGLAAGLQNRIPKIKDITIKEKQ